MMRSVARETLIAATTASRSARTSVMSAASMATSEPVPMAIPKPAAPAWARAAASLTPSPTMATLAPSPCRRATTSRLSSGSTWAITSSIPTWAAMNLAARSLSPVSRMGRSPIALSSLMALAVVGLGSSRTARAARRRNDFGSDPEATSTTVAPVSSKARTWASACSRLTPCWLSQVALPTTA